MTPELRIVTDFEAPMRSRRYLVAPPAGCEGPVERVELGEATRAQLDRAVCLVVSPDVRRAMRGHA